MTKRIMFAGGDTQTGTTMIAMSVAEELAKQGRKVLYVGVRTIGGADFLEDNSEGTLTLHELELAVTDSRGVDVLTGLRKSRYGTFFYEEDIAEILRATSGTWDYVILDGGFLLSEEKGNADSLIASLKDNSNGNGSDMEILVVITQQEKSLRRCRKWKSLHDGSQIGAQDCLGKIKFVLNKYNDTGAFYTEKEVADYIGCEAEDIRTVPYIPYGWQAEEESSTLLKFRDFRKGIRRVKEWCAE